MSTVQAVEDEVREPVRRRRYDPVVDRSAVRRLVEEVASDDDDRALTSSLTPLADRALTARTVYDAVAGFGNLQRHLDDPTVGEVWILERLTGGWALSGRVSTTEGLCLVPHRTATGLRVSA